MPKMKKRVIRAGKMLEVNYYPVGDNGKVIPNENKKTTKTKKEMDEANKRKAVRNLIRLINTNFDSNDYVVTLTYRTENTPLSLENAEKDFVKMINRIKYAIKKKGGDVKKFKYCYVPAMTVYKKGQYQGLVNYHFHLFMSGGFLSTREIKDMWWYGTKGNVEHYDPYRYGPEAFTKYMLNGQEAGHRMYRCSRNMKRPIIEEEKNAGISRDKLDRLIREHGDDPRYWEKKYPSYDFCRLDKYYNEINGCWYLNVIMYKSPPKKSYYQKSRKASLAYA